jgi:hypothetical protein
MAIIKITKADILKTKNVTPGWYQCQVIKVHPPNKAKESTTINYVFDCVILSGQEGADKEIPARFNSALIGKMAPFYFACTGKQIDPEEGIDTDDLMGKKFDGKIVPQQYQGQLYDNFDNFVPFGASKDVPF